MRFAILFISFLLVVSFAIAQSFSTSENELKVRFTSLGSNTTVNLTRFLGEGNYTHTKSENILINIKDGIAELRAKPNWKGAEEITFYKEAVINQTQKIIIALPKKMPFDDKKLEREVNNLLLDRFNETYYEIIYKIKPEQIEEIATKYEKDKLEITINKEMEIQVNTEQAQPKIIMKILSLKETAAPSPPKKFELNLRPIITILLIIFAIFLVYTSRNYFLQIRLKIRHKKDKEIKKKKLLSKLNKIDIKNKNALQQLQYILYEFFIIFFAISRNDTEYELESHLNKKEITGYLKQEILLLFSKMPKLTDKEMPQTVEILKYILRKM